MARSIDYETTRAPTSFEVAAGNLGKRSDEDTLSRAFGTSTGDDAGASRTTAGNQTELLNLAKAKMAEYTGENPMFPQYRRSFEPGGSVGLTAEYVEVRDKNTVVTGVGTGLGTAYSPTIASPGAQNKFDPSNLQSVASTANGAAVVSIDNPSDEVHQNVDSLGRVDGIAPTEKVTGTVRRFTLGVGSGGASTTTEVAARGQFPRPLT